MTFNEKDVIINSTKGSTSLYSISTDRAGKEPDFTSNQNASDNIIHMVDNEPDVTRNMINHQTDDENTIVEDNEMDVDNNTIDVQECNEDRTMADDEMDVANKTVDEQECDNNRTMADNETEVPEAMKIRLPKLKTQPLI